MHQFMLSSGDGEMKVLNIGKYKDISNHEERGCYCEKKKKSRGDYDKQSVMNYQLALNNYSYQ